MAWRRARAVAPVLDADLAGALAAAMAYPADADMVRPVSVAHPAVGCESAETAADADRQPASAAAAERRVAVRRLVAPTRPAERRLLVAAARALRPLPDAQGTEPLDARFSARASAPVAAQLLWAAVP
jgi:hypothetical protein